MARMTGFVFQDKYLVRLEKLSDQEVGRLVRALAAYHATGETQELKGRECGYYDFIKADIDEIEERYHDKCEKNKRNRSPTIVNDRQQLLSNADKYKRKEKENNNKDDDDDDEGTTTVCARAFARWIGRRPYTGEENALTHIAHLQGQSDDLLELAIQTAAEHGANAPAMYAEKTLRDWALNGVKTLDDYYNMEEA